jgi:hypothetical protein
MKGILRSLVVVRDVVRVWCVATGFGYGLGYEAGRWRGWIARLDCKRSAIARLSVALPRVAPAAAFP